MLQQPLEAYSTHFGQDSTTLSKANLLAFSPDSRLLATSCDDWRVRLWVVSSTQQQALEGYGYSSLSFSPDSRTLASTDHSTLRLWDTVRVRQEYPFEGHSGRILAIVFSLDGSLLASGFYDVRLWDTVTGTLKRTLEAPPGPIDVLSFSPDGQKLVATYQTRYQVFRIWDTATGSLLHTLEDEDCIWPVWPTIVSPGGDLLASGSYDNTLQLWSTETGALHTWTLESTITGFESSLS